MRLDLFMVQKKLAQTRSKAQILIKNGQVLVNGQIANKTGLEVDNNDKVEIKGEVNPFVSKGGLKLKKAIDAFNLDFSGKNVIDIGASTGGFTDCALQSGANKVYAIDVGHGQMHSKLKNNSRVVLFEDTDFRTIDKNLISDANFIIGDVSFISLEKLLPKICELNINDVVLLIKPQFECGIKIAKRYKGVIKDRSVHSSVLNHIIGEFKKSGYLCNNITFSPITGGDGNIEYIAHFKKCGVECKTDTNILIDNAFNNFGMWTCFFILRCNYFKVVDTPQKI